MTIQWLIDNIGYDGMVLLDSDVIVKRNIDFINSKYITVADI